MANLILKNIYKVYEGGVRAVSDFNLEIDDKEFVVFVGPSGCGKSTTLRMIAGLEEITAGELYIDGEKMNDVEPKDRNIAMVFQNYALYPHMTVFQNMAFGLKLRKTEGKEIERRVRRAAEILGISELLTRKPKALSGGQRQRVALGRAIVREPNVFLLDEPLSNLDAKLRVQMRTEITKLHKKLATTFIYVTHDQTEAMTMGDRIVVMKDGVVQQADTPSMLYEQPANVFVATFLGSPQMNVFPAVLQKEEQLSVAFEGGKIVFSEEKAKQLSDASQIGKEVLFGIRPENISLAEAGVEAVIDVVEHLGSETIVYAAVSGIENDLVVTCASNHDLRAGQQIHLSFDTDKAHVFDAKTTRSVMGVPEVNVLPCRLQEGKAIFAGGEVPLPAEMLSRLTDFAERECVRMDVRSDKVSLREIDGFPVECEVAFTVKGNDGTACFCKCPLVQDGYFTFRAKGEEAPQGKVTAYVPFSAVTFRAANGDRLNSKEVVSDNIAPCTVKKAGEKRILTVGGQRLVFENLQAEEGEYRIQLLSDKLSFRYSAKYAKKNKADVGETKGAKVVAKAYDEDKIGERNVVFLKIKGWNDYVTAVFPNVFSVYEMPVFDVVLQEDSFRLLPKE